MLSAYKLMIVLAVAGSISACSRDNNSKKSQGRAEIGTGASKPADGPKATDDKKSEPDTSRDGTRSKDENDQKRPQATATPGDLPGAVDAVEVELNKPGSQTSVTATVSTSKAQASEIAVADKKPTQLQSLVTKQVGEFTAASSDGLRQDLVRSILQKPAAQQQAIFDAAGKVLNSDLDINYDTGTFSIQLLGQDGSAKKITSLCGKLDGEREGKICSNDGAMKVSGKLKCLDVDEDAMCINAKGTYNNCTTALADLRVYDEKTKTEVPLWIIFRRSEVDIKAELPTEPSYSMAYKNFQTMLVGKEIYATDPRVLQTSQLESVEVIGGMSKVNLILMTSGGDLMGLEGSLYSPSIIESQFKGAAPMKTGSFAALAYKERNPKYKFKSSMHESIDKVQLLENSMFKNSSEKNSDLTIGFTLKNSKNSSGQTDLIKFSLSREKYMNPINKPQFPDLQLAQP